LGETFGNGGFELQRWLAAGNYGIPIIFITAHDSDDVHIEVLRAGAPGPLCKPFCQEALFHAARAALANQHDIQHES
jgi:DNA-binding response OmpR family regulator